MSETLLTVEDLSIRFRTRHGMVQAVKGVNFQMREGETLAVVGESGSGKSVTALALTRLLPETCGLSGRIHYAGREMLDLDPAALRDIRGKEIAYIFQEPLASLNPVFTVGEQIAEAIRYHYPRREVREQVVEALARVGIREPERRYRDYPHQLSGGMNQRVMIAMALACQPRLLIADEPTTALDVTIQAEIMALLKRLRTETGMAILLITHNFGIVKNFADRVAVMFRGEVVEFGDTAQVLAEPRHPYTRALIECIPRLGSRRRRLATIDHAQLEEDAS